MSTKITDLRGSRVRPIHRGSVWQACGKPSTKFPHGGLVECPSFFSRSLKFLQFLYISNFHKKWRFYWNSHSKNLRCDGTYFFSLPSRALIISKLIFDIRSTTNLKHFSSCHGAKSLHKFIILCGPKSARLSHCFRISFKPAVNRQPGFAGGTSRAIRPPKIEILKILKYNYFLLEIRNSENVENLPKLPPSSKFGVRWKSQ